MALETARAYLLNGDGVASIEIGDRIMEKAEAILPPSAVLDGIITRATALARVRPMEAAALVTGAVALADQYELQAQGMRASNNLAVLRSFDSQRVELSDLEEFIARARRLGAAVWLNRALLDAAIAYIEWGDLAHAEALLDELESYPLNEFERQGADEVRARVAVIREGTHAQLDELWRAVSVWDDSNDTQLQAAGHGLKSLASALRGDFDASLEHSLLEDYSSGAVLAAMASMALRSTEAIERSHSFAEKLLPHGSRLKEFLDQLFDTSLRALGGDASGAADEYVEALGLIDRVLAPHLAAVVRAVMFGMVGDAHPAVTEAGRAARSWFRDHGFRRWEIVLSDYLPADDIDAAETA